MTYADDMAEKIKLAVQKGDLGAAIDILITECRLAYEFNPNSYSMGALTAALRVKQMHRKSNSRAA
jgi:hypothetical protein